MSYTRSVSVSVPYSGSVSYSYPRSESGGSGYVNYSGTVPVTFNVNVDTIPFDSSVDKTNVSLLGLASAVSSMQIAECNAIKESGDKIANAAISGFFKMIESEVSQQMVENSAKISSSIALLQEQSKQVQHYHNQMNEDFNRIKARYLKIFEELDTECYRRIYELDNKCFELSTKVRKELLVENYTGTPAICFLKTLEDGTTNLKLSLARLKNMTNKVISNFLQNVKDQNDFSYNTEKLSLKNVLPEDKTYYVPSVVLKCNKLNESNIDQTMYFVSEGIDEKTKSQFPQKFDKENVAESLNLNSSDKEKIKTFFMQQAEALVSDSEDKELNLRVYKNIIALWENQK